MIPPTGSDGVRQPVRTAFVSYACIAAAVWLGWEVVKAPVVDRANPAIAVRLAPQSPEVLRVAAEAEFAAGRFDNAQALSSESLRRAPFNARALRVRGLVEAKGPETERASDIMTLAGNWSLRDDPAHAWLMEQRLRRGDYSSAFAHADTLARRRSDLHPRLFELFTVAAQQDRRALPHLAGLLAASPPWRPAYLNALHAREDGDPLLAELAIALQRTRSPFTDSELGHLYRMWATERRFAGIRFLRERLDRPPIEQTLQNAGFERDVSIDILPFDWRIGLAPGVDVQITEDDVRDGETALRVSYDGRAPVILVEQLTNLAPGRFRFSGELRREQAGPSDSLRWTLACAEAGQPLSEMVIDQTRPGVGKWEPFSVEFTIPAANCSAQWLRLDAAADDRRSYYAVWFDHLQIQSLR